MLSRRTSVWRRVRGATQRRQSARKRADSLSEVLSRGRGNKADSTVESVSGERGIFGVAAFIVCCTVAREEEVVLLADEETTVVGTRPPRANSSVVFARTWRPKLSGDLKATFGDFRAK